MTMGVGGLSPESMRAIQTRLSTQQATPQGNPYTTQSAAPPALAPRYTGGAPPPTNNSSSQQDIAALQGQYEELRKYYGMSEDEFRRIFPQIADRYNNELQQRKGEYDNTQYGLSQGANWYRPGGDPNAPWRSGQNAPMAGVDQRVASNIYNPLAYEYGGRPGMAQEEAARFGGLAELARQQQNAAYGQYGESLGMSDQARAQQLQGLQMLQGVAQGTGPSAAMGQMAQGLSQARNQQASIAASARGGGGNLAAAQAASANAAGQMSLQGIQGASALRSQEQLGAMAQYGQQAGQLRASDYARAQMAQQQQQLSYGQASEQERYRQQVFAQQQGYQQAQEQQNLAREAAQRGWNLQQKANDTAERNTWIQAGTSAAAIAAMMAMSDERAKENVSDGGKDVDDALSALKPVNFSYKPGLGQEEGEHTGIMAQHLASTKAGAKAVMTGPDGLLRVKAPQAATLALAGLARLAERLNKLEKKNAR